MADARAHLIRTLLEDAAGSALMDAVSHPWASATFLGERHCLRLVLPLGAADRLARDLPEREFAIPGHLVADIVMVAREPVEGGDRVVIEALVIEAR